MNDRKTSSCRSLGDFLRYSCGWATLLIVLALSLLQTVFNLGVSESLKMWVGLPHSEQKGFRLTFLLIVGLFLLVSVFSNMLMSCLLINASRNLHTAMLRGVVRTQVSFFD